MQIAGTTCGACGVKIVFEGEGQGCSQCQATFHQGCLQDPAHCPACRADLRLAAEQAAERGDHDLQARLGRGRAIVLAVIALLLLGPTLGVIESAISHASGPAEDLSSRILATRPLLQFVFALALCAALYWGSAGVRTYLRVASLLGALLYGFGAWTALDSNDAELAGVRAFSCISMAAMFWALTLSKSVDAFLRRSLLHSPRG